MVYHVDVELPCPHTPSPAQAALLSPFSSSSFLLSINLLAICPRHPVLLHSTTMLTPFPPLSPSSPPCRPLACSKKYEIEVMQGEKVVSRSRGFTVDTCVSGKTASEETPMFNGLSTGAKVGTHMLHQDSDVITYPHPTHKHTTRPPC